MTETPSPTPASKSAKVDSTSASMDPDANSEVLLAGRSPRRVAVFLLLVVAWLGADLIVKRMAFDRVAGTPIRLSVGEDHQPQVWVPSPHVPPQDRNHQFAFRTFPGTAPNAAKAESGGSWWRLSPRRLNEDGTVAHPATAVPDHPGMNVLPGLLRLRLTINTGAVFGSGAGLRPVFIAVSAVAVLLISFFFARSDARAWMLHLCLAMILAGALGNLYDRIRFAAVRDMFLMLPETGLWPYIFNVADVALVLGVTGMIVGTWWTDRQRAKAFRAAERSDSSEAARGDENSGPTAK